MVDRNDSYKIERKKKRVKYGNKLKKRTIRIVERMEVRNESKRVKVSFKFRFKLRRVYLDTECFYNEFNYLIIT